MQHGMDCLVSFTAINLGFYCGAELPALTAYLFGLGSGCGMVLCGSLPISPGRPCGRYSKLLVPIACQRSHQHKGERSVGFDEGCTIPVRLTPNSAAPVGGGILTVSKHRICSRKNCVQVLTRTS